MDDVTPANSPPPPRPDRSELAELHGGPAAGLRLRVTDRPAVLQITRPCPVEEAPGGDEFGITEVYVYRRDWRMKSPPLRYGYDPASP
ncbi:hypothetical protein [Streptomyces sp. NPDC058373]|uniref:hypothetical protein n=1 Tax=unclassified Streptomyces TaxID=2593676 RepID=UPI00365A2835